MKIQIEKVQHTFQHYIKTHFKLEQSYFVNNQPKTFGLNFWNLFRDRCGVGYGGICIAFLVTANAGSV